MIATALPNAVASGMTKSMKVAISIPDDLFEEADRLAKLAGAPRSAIYAEALSAYVDAHSPDRVTDALDAVVEAIGMTSDPFVGESARRSLAATEW